VENVMMPALVSERKTDETLTRALHLLEIVGLKDRTSHKPGELSGGEQQRVAIARSLMMSPKVLLADEPTGDLDPATGQKIIDLFSELKNIMGVTMIIATHNMELAKTMDRIMILKGGHLESFTP
jgi:lipoprotein-releasing system ATP-binding protein